MKFEIHRSLGDAAGNALGEMVCIILGSGLSEVFDGI